MRSIGFYFVCTRGIVQTISQTWSIGSSCGESLKACPDPDSLYFWFMALIIYEYDCFQMTMNRLRIMANTSWTVMQQMKRQGVTATSFSRSLATSSATNQQSPSNKDEPLDHLKDNPYYKKYAEKLQAKQQYVCYEFKIILGYYLLLPTRL